MESPKRREHSKDGEVGWRVQLGPRLRQVTYSVRGEGVGREAPSGQVACHGLVVCRDH